VLIGTWNINGIRARMLRLTEWLAERKPDFVCLQELKITEDEFPHLELRAAGYQAVLSGQAGWNGVAVLAKGAQAPEVVMRELPGASELGARFIVTKVNIDKGPLEITSLYVPNGKSVTHVDYKVKLNWLDRLATHIESRADKDAPMLVAGDFNICPTDLDSFGGAKFKGHIHHTDPERAIIKRLHDAGLVDLYRSRYPDEPGFSWWDYRAGCFHKKQGMRIDLIFATPVFAARVRDVYIDREFRKKGKPSGSVPSDHAPVVAVVDEDPVRPAGVV
jgi:exodeoxyribonuclease III